MTATVPQSEPPPIANRNSQFANPTVPTPLLTFRTAQKALLRCCEDQRLIGFLARRQYGKTTTFSAIALKKMMRRPNHLVTYASATLLLGRELILKESQIIQRAITALAKQAAAANTILEVTDRDRKTSPSDAPRQRTSYSSEKSDQSYSSDDFADLFEHQRLELRLHHDRNTVSRTIIIAPNPATAVGWTGDVMLDEVGRIRDFRGLWEAVEPIASSDPTFRLLLCTTPPPDDAHFSFEMLAPPIGTELPVNPEGNWYRSEMGILVLRVDAHDAWADGVPVYDLERGEPLEPAEHRRRALDKDAWDRNYGCQFLMGGTSAVGLLQLDTAQRRGIGKCTCISIDTDSDLDRAITFLHEHIGAGQVGIGLDLATTEKQTSNPTAITIIEREGIELIATLTCVWKTRDPALAKDRIRRIVQAVADRPKGGRARGLGIDSTSERYFAAELARDLRPHLPVHLLVSSETIQLPGQEACTLKSYLGNLFVAELDDNHVTLAPERYIKDDFRLVKRDRGTFATDISPDGRHGDTFDSHKNAVHVLTAKPAYSATLI